MVDDETPIDNDELKRIMFKEIDIIQDIIKRMASNSFVIKGWAITLVVVSMILSGNVMNFYIAFLPVFVFWSLDTYYLHQERLYVKLYEWIIENRMKNSKVCMLDMRTKRFRKEVSLIRTMLSRTIAPFYGFIIALIILFIIAFSLL